MGHLVRCDNCKYDILGGSPLQKYLCQLIITMLHSLIPYELLSWENYNTFYMNYLDNNQKIKSQKFEPDNFYKDYLNNIYSESYYFNHKLSPKSRQKNKYKSYTTNCGKLWAQMYYYLFTKIFGSFRSTRYQHILCFFSEYYFYLSYMFKITPRGLFGTDPGEHMNDKIKSLIHQITNKFTTSNCSDIRMPCETIAIIMKYLCWDYYYKRENNSKCNTEMTSKVLERKQRKQDAMMLALPIKIYNYWRKWDNTNNSINCKWEYEMMNVIELQYNNDYFLDENKKWDKEDIFLNDNLLNTQIILEESLKNVDVAFHVYKESEISVYDRNKDLNLNEVIQNDKIRYYSEEEDIDYDEYKDKYGDNDIHESNHKKKNNNKPSKFENKFSNNNIDEISCWIDNKNIHNFIENADIQINKDSFVCIGSLEFFMRLQFLDDSGFLYDDYRIGIKWSNVAHIIVCNASNGHDILLCIKFANKPIIKHSNNKDIVNDLPDALQKFINHPKIQILLKCCKYTRKQIQNYIDHHERISDFQRGSALNYHVFKHQINYSYNKQEQDFVKINYLSQRTPFLQEHLQLCQAIKLGLYKMFDAREGRRCAVCNKLIGYFEEHAICFSKQEDSLPTVDNDIPRNIFEGKNNLTLNSIVVEEVDMNYQMKNTIPSFLLKRNANLWVTFLLKIYYKCMLWIIEMKSIEARECRVDSDWLDLYIPLTDWLKILDTAMIECMNEDKFDLEMESIENDDNDTYILICNKIFGCVCELFYITKVQQRKFINSNVNAIMPSINIIFKNHYMQQHILKPLNFVTFLTDYHSHYYKFEFWRKIQNEYLQ